MPTIAVNYDVETIADIHLDRFERLPSCILADRLPRVAAG
jgi:hypothetical protein